MEFKVGDRVKCIKAGDENIHALNKIGTIIHIDHRLIVGVEFDDHVNGHDEFGGQDGHVWNFSYSRAEDYLEPIVEFTTWEERYKK